MSRSAVILLLFLFGCGATQPATGLDQKPLPASPGKALGGAPAAGEVAGWDTAAWERFLGEHVDAEGRVDYRAAASSSDLQLYVAQLATVRPADLRSSNARKAFWINTYNAAAIYAVTQTIPDDPTARAAYSVIRVARDGLPPGKGFFQGIGLDVGGRRWTLDEIEKQVLFRRWQASSPSLVATYRAWAPDQADPRLHFALVCCALGCPQLQRFAYRGVEVDAQLDQVTAAFFNDVQKSRFDMKRRTWQVSELLDWYGGDFVATDHAPRAETLAKFAAKYMTDSGVASALAEGRLKISYLPYDWTLNAQP